MRELLTLKEYLLKYKNRLLIGFVFIVLTNLFTVAAPRVLGYAIDSISKDANFFLLAIYAGTIFLIAVIQGVFRFYMRQIVIGVSRWIEYDLRNDFFAHLEKLSMNFFLNYRTGDIMSRATNDLNAVRMVLGPGIMYSITTITMFVFAVFLMLSINVRLTIYAMIPFPLLSFFISKFGSLIHKRFEKIQEQFSNMSAFIQENFAGIRVVKAYVREDNEIKEFRKQNKRYFDKSKSLIKVRSIFLPIIELIGGIGVLIILWYGGYQVILGKISIGDFVAFNGYLLLLLWPVIALGWVISLFQRGSASMGRMNKIFNIEPDIKDEEDVIKVENIDGEIEFKDLTFSYNNAKEPVLKNINLKIKKGMTLAIVGHIGSGKTTLVNLIPRIFDAPEGSILIDGIPIRRIPLKTLRKNIGYVPQDTFLFSDTIKENIVYGVKDVSGDEIIEAAEVSQILAEIEEFPEKFDTLLGERGINLSGGQKQRLSISRTIIKKPKILILDDALSSVDTYTEGEILKRLKEFMKERTSIIVSHRISTVQDADLIIVLYNGMIAEQGMHKDLVEKDGIYASLYRKQLIAEELEKY
ncbi:ABC transporter ATP-binding protein [candidate division KSB1 bacterium]